MSASAKILIVEDDGIETSELIDSEFKTPIINHNTENRGLFL